MATNFDKAIYGAPQGINTLAEQEEPLEIEIVDPEAVNIKAGDLEISIQPDEETDDFHANLADDIDAGDLDMLAGELAEAIENDRGSRKDWEKSYKEGLKLLGLQYEERTEPWNGACGVFHPMITEAVVRFQSEAITESFPAQGPVRTKILGKETPEKKEAARRVEDDMNYELTEVMREFRPEHERMLWSLPATGSAFKKVYFDPALDRQVSMFVPAEDIILPYGASDMDTCYRVTHVMRKTEQEIIRLQQAGFYRDITLPDPSREQTEIQKAKDRETGFSDLNDDRYIIYEVHADLDIAGFEDKDEDGEETGIARPYVITIVKGTNDVLAVRRNWKKEDELCRKRQHFVKYDYIPGFGAYGFGLFHLIGGFAKSATSIMRQLVDAGTLSNLPGGLKSRGLRIKGDDTPIAPGEWRDVDIGSGALRDNILPLPYKEPSNVLYQLLSTIVDEGRRFAATADMQVSDMSAQAPVGTTLALLERQLKVMTAVQARLHNSFKQELRLLAQIIKYETDAENDYEPEEGVQARLHYSFKQELRLLAQIIKDETDAEYDYDPEEGPRKAKKSDYNHVDIIPVSDPNAATLSQRVVQYQAVIQMAQMAPDIYDLPQLHRQMLEILGVKHADKLVPLPEDMKPRDPVTENMNLMKSEPVKAFFYQDHKSHIQVHMAMIQDPTIAQALGQNPKAQQISAALMEHIAEHAGFLYRYQVEQQLGAALPKYNDDLPPEAEYALSNLIAQASKQVVDQNKAQQAKEQAQQQAQDPLIQMQMQELQIKQQELQMKQQETQARIQLDSQKAQLDAQLKQQDMQLKMQVAAAQAQSAQAQAQAQAGKTALDQERLALDREKMTGDMQLAGMRMGAQIQESKAKQDAQHEIEGLRIGTDIAKHKAQVNMQNNQRKQEKKS